MLISAKKIIYVDKLITDVQARTIVRNLTNE